ncbi:MAG: methyltransferase domain-containing protein [Phycisphaeraceae bacterium]|nr:methyltransferase domain-containing protein [Phycisphaeraceae bacterium]
MADVRSARGAQILYDRMAGVYDATFGRLVHHRQRIGIEELGLQPGHWVLDVGIGTGLSLDLYPPEVNVVGVDLSSGMLQKAAARPTSRRPGRWLVQANALQPPFGAGAFDAAVITHVISCVPDPPGLLEATARLIRPGGSILLLNHFRSDFAPIAMMERLLNPICIRLGWRSDLSFEDAVGGSNLSVDRRWKLRKIDLWTLARLGVPESKAPATS